MPGVSGISDVTEGQRCRAGPQAEDGVVQRVGNVAVVSPSSELQRFLVPVRWQVHLELDVRRGRIDGLDAAHHLAVLAIRIACIGRLHERRGGHDRAVRR